MAYFDKYGKQANYIPQVGKYIIDGKAYSLQEAINQGLIYPDAKSMPEARSYGYRGDTIQETAAKGFAEKEMEGMPEWESLLGKDGLLESPYQLTSPESIQGMFQDVVEQYGLPGYEKAMSGADYLSDIAKSEGMSPYALAQMEQQRLEEGSLRDALQTSLAGSRATGLSNLASTGGYDSGARERMMSNLGVQGLIGGQGIARQGATTRAGIGASDALYKQNILSSLPGTYSSLATTGTNLWNPYLNQASKEQGYDYSTNQYNINNALQEISGKRAYDLDTFKTRKGLESSARQSYAESPYRNSYVSDLYV